VEAQVRSRPGGRTGQTCQGQQTQGRGGPRSAVEGVDLVQHPGRRHRQVWGQGVDRGVVGDEGDLVGEELVDVPEGAAEAAQGDVRPLRDILQGDAPGGRFFHELERGAEDGPVEVYHRVVPARHHGGQRGVSLLDARQVEDSVEDRPDGALVVREHLGVQGDPQPARREPRDGEVTFSGRGRRGQGVAPLVERLLRGRPGHRGAPSVSRSS